LNAGETMRLSSSMSRSPIRKKHRFYVGIAERLLNVHRRRYWCVSRSQRVMLLGLNDSLLERIEAGVAQSEEKVS
jgi:hypothetical protein